MSLWLMILGLAGGVPYFGGEAYRFGFWFALSMAILFLIQKSLVQVTSQTESKTIRVVLIDDDRISSMVMEKMILNISDKFVVESYFDATEGLVKLKKSPPDLILLDMMMPNIRGDYIIRKLKKDQPDLLRKIIVYSSLSEDADMMKDVIENQVRIIQKPIQLQELKHNVLAICPVKMMSVE